MTQKTVEEKITLLTNAWYQYVGAGGHKDRDMQFSITTQWSYGDAPLYEVEHNAYMGNDIEGKFTSYHTAQHFLLSSLMVMVQEQIDWMVSECEVSGDYDSHFCDGQLRTMLQKALEEVNAAT
jgi:hypothetical protein